MSSYNNKEIVSYNKTKFIYNATKHFFKYNPNIIETEVKETIRCFELIKNDFIVLGYDSGDICIVDLNKSYNKFYIKDCILKTIENNKESESIYLNQILKIKYISNYKNINEKNNYIQEELLFIIQQRSGYYYFLNVLLTTSNNNTIIKNTTSFKYKIGLNSLTKFTYNLNNLICLSEVETKILFIKTDSVFNFNSNTCLTNCIKGNLDINNSCKLNNNENKYNLISYIDSINLNCVNNNNKNNIENINLNINAVVLGTEGCSLFFVKINNISSNNLEELNNPTFKNASNVKSSKFSKKIELNKKTNIIENNNNFKELTTKESYIIESYIDNINNYKPVLYIKSCCYFTRINEFNTDNNICILIYVSYYSSEISIVKYDINSNVLINCLLIENLTSINKIGISCIDIFLYREDYYIISGSFDFRIKVYNITKYIKNVTSNIDKDNRPNVINLKPIETNVLDKLVVNMVHIDYLNNSCLMYVSTEDNKIRVYNYI